MDAHRPFKVRRRSRSPWVWFFVNAAMFFIILVQQFQLSMTLWSERSNDTIVRYLSASYSRIGGHPDLANLKRVVRVVEGSWGLFNFGSVDKLDIYAMFFVEDPEFKASLIGSKGEIGQGQLMPSSVVTARKILHREDLDPFIVEDNVLMSLTILETKVMKYQKRDLSIIAYNGYVMKDGVLSRKYVNRVEEVKRVLLEEKAIARLRWR